MNEFAPLLVLILFWFFFGPVLSRAKKRTGGKTGTAPKKSSAGQAAGGSEPSGPPAAAAGRMPVSAASPAAAVSPISTGKSVRPAPGAYVPLQGSLNVSSQEGLDPCHEEQAHEMDLLRAETAGRESVPAGGLSLSWSGNDVVRGFVYGEILNRRKSHL